MRRKTLYLLAAISAFFFGLGVFRASNLVDYAEEQIANLLTSTPRLEAPVELQLRGELTEENEIYKTLIQQMFVDASTKMLVIESKTTGCPFYESGELAGDLGHPQDFFTNVKEIMPTAERITLDDYLAKNREARQLLVSDIGVNYRLISSEQVNQFFSQNGFGQGWNRFYKEYPDSSGLLFFSKVGFNPQHDQAFLYAGRSCGGLCGAGSYVLLKKEGGRWIVAREQGLWVS